MQSLERDGNKTKKETKQKREDDEGVEVMMGCVVRTNPNHHCESSDGRAHHHLKP